MKVFEALRGVAAAACVAIGLIVVVASGAIAAPLRICVPETEGKPIKTPKGGVCAAKTTATVVLAEAEEQKLAAILPYEKYVASGVGGKPTIQFSGANVQILSGAGEENALNGEGNLIVGYDNFPGAQTQAGSNNLAIGGSYNPQNYTSFGSILGGAGNTASGEYSVVFGVENTASGDASSVTGGGANTASGFQASVSGGLTNTASENAASVSGGEKNTASGPQSSVSGGYKNTALGQRSSIFGSHELETTALYQYLPEA